MKTHTMSHVLHSQTRRLPLLIPIAFTLFTALVRAGTVEMIDPPKTFFVRPPATLSFQTRSFPDLDYYKIDIRRDSDHWFWRSHRHQWVDPSTETLAIRGGVSTYSPFGTEYPANHVFSTPSEDMPTSDQFEDGPYTIYLQLSDYGLFVDTNYRYTETIWIDKTPPVLAVQTPADGSVMQRLLAIAGTVREGGTSGSGLDDSPVTVRLQGPGFPTPLILPVQVNGGAWFSPPLPTEFADSLLPGSYQILVSAQDRVANTVEQTVNFSIDRATLNLTISSPAHGEAWYCVSDIRGQVSLTNGAVSLTLRRKTDNRFWSVYSRDWVTTAATFPATEGAGYNWARTAGLPEAYQWTEGAYEIIADTGRRIGYLPVLSTNSFFIVRSAPPLPFVTHPGANQSVRYIDRAVGRYASPLVNGQRIDRVDLRLRRVSDGRYWDGQTWQLQAVGLPTEFSDSTWNTTGMLPYGNNQFPEGHYSIEVAAADQFSNRSLFRAHTFTADRTAPVVQITQPPHNAVMSSLTAINGTVSHSPDTVTHVNINLSRSTNSMNAEYWLWDEGVWTNGMEALGRQSLAVEVIDGVWSVTSGLPVFAAGFYGTVASAEDAAGNVGNAVASFRIGSQTGPELQFTQPANNAWFTFTPQARITASDPGGVTQIQVWLQRASDSTPALYYDFTAGEWSTNFVEAAMVRNAIFETVNWYYLLPQLPVGTYMVHAKGQNGAGIWSESALTMFEIRDIENPELLITTPAPGEQLTDPAVLFLGTASDNRGLAGVSVVLERFRAQVFPEYYVWSNATWSATWSESACRTNALLVEANWGIVLPPLAGGYYRASAIAEDTSGYNSGYIPREFSIVDTDLPVNTITFPAHGTVHRRLTTVEGTLTDADSGPGYIRLQLYREREGQGEYWDGNAWTNEPFASTVLVEDGQWRYTQGPDLGALESGEVIVRAIGFDQTLNQHDIQVSVTVDRTVPNILSLTQPSHGSRISQLTEIAGLISDAGSPEGPNRVEVILQRNQDSLWWDGLVWTNARTSIVVVEASGTHWSLTSFLPINPADLPAGGYQITALGYDAVGNQTGVMSDFTAYYDVTPPELAILTPVGATNGIAVIAGTVTDEPDGSGVATVQASLRRLTDDFYWTGSSWSPPPILLDVLLDGSAWSLTNLPGEGQWTEGRYSITVRAYDGANNQGIASQEAFLDWTAPDTPVLQLPVPGETNSTLPAIVLLAADNAGGCGLADTSVQLKRLEDARFWDGTAWVAEEAELKTRLANNLWEVKDPLPQGSNLMDGEYKFILQARDLAGNGRTAMFIYWIVVSDDEIRAVIDGTVSIGADGQLRFTFTGQPGRTYRVVASEDLGTWETVDTLVAPPDGVMEFAELPVPGMRQRFYKVVTP
jgi:hypothetical protein